MGQVTVFKNHLRYLWPGYFALAFKLASNAFVNLFADTVAGGITSVFFSATHLAVAQLQNTPSIGFV